jgi:hypothetical protein|tara:strand:+ start:1252 stop:1599 length:348 start_codon:yes stop_codon:yes gene_type:complete
MQQLQTITKKTTTNVESIHVDTVYTVLQNCFNKLQMLDADCTGSNYYINSANIYAQLLTLYAAYASNVDFISLQEVMQCFTNNITYVDESSLFTQVVENTAMQNVVLRNYMYLSN